MLVQVQLHPQFQFMDACDNGSRPDLNSGVLHGIGRSSRSASAISLE